MAGSLAFDSRWYAALCETPPTPRRGSAGLTERLVWSVASLALASSFFFSPPSPALAHLPEASNQHHHHQYIDARLCLVKILLQSVRAEGSPAQTNERQLELNSAERGVLLRDSDATMGVAECGRSGVVEFALFLGLGC